jgi:uncharacterized membrane protein YfcA
VSPVYQRARRGDGSTRPSPRESTVAVRLSAAPFAARTARAFQTPSCVVFGAAFTCTMCHVGPATLLTPAAARFNNAPDGVVTSMSTLLAVTGWSHTSTNSSVTSDTELTSITPLAVPGGPEASDSDSVRTVPRSNISAN